jgi:Tfp pilus assembly protein PilE
VTVIELLFAGAILSILTGLAAIALKRDLHKAHSSEVVQMFGDFQMKEELYKSLNGTYLSSGSDTETDLWPTHLAGGDRKVDISAGLPTSWQTLKIDPGTGGLYCQYAAIEGAGGSTAHLGTIGMSLYAGAAPASEWYYLVAQCDWDGDPTLNSSYSRRGDRTDLQRSNEGR